jgi:hypothetical protein
VLPSANAEHSRSAGCSGRPHANAVATHDVMVTSPFSVEYAIKQIKQPDVFLRGDIWKIALNKVVDMHLYSVPKFFREI